MNLHFTARSLVPGHIGEFYDPGDFVKKEIVDLTVSENILFQSERNTLSRIFNILVGDHCYIIDPGHAYNPPAKGLLDFLIFPLISRALIWGPESMIAQIVGFTIAIPLEIARFSLGISLTLLIAPIVALIDAIQNYLPQNSLENTPSLPNATA